MPRLRSSLLLLPLLLLIPSHTKASEPDRQIPVSTEGTLVVFEVEDLRCVLYVNESGMAGGAGNLACVPRSDVLPLRKVLTPEFHVLQVIKTSKDK